MLKVGLIGLGFMGTQHANCYKNIPGVELAALADIRVENAKALAEGTNATVYSSGEELIEKADVDIIDICLPTYLHACHALKAMDKVKYLFVEKPVALTAEECDAMLAKSKETGCQVQVGLVIRFWEEYVEMAKLVKSGKYGSVVNANFRRISPRPTWGWENWLLDAKLSGGSAQDMHIHDIDFVLSMFGEPEKFYTVKNSKGETNSYVNTLMQYSDFPVTVEGTWGLPTTHPFEASFRVVMEKATLELSGGALYVYTDEGVEQVEIQKEEVAGDSFEGGNISDLGAYYNELVYFCEKAKKQEAVDIASLADGVSSLKFLLNEIK